MATKINATPTNDVNFDASATFNDDFSEWLTKMVPYWKDNYTGCTFEIRKVGTEPEGLSVEISTEQKTTGTGNCLTFLGNSLSSNNKITIRNISTVTQNAYSVIWKKEATKSQEEKKPEKEKELEYKKGPGKVVSSLFGGIADKVMGGIQTGLGAFGGNADKVMGGIQTGLGAFGEQNENNTKLLEEIDRIKELIK